MGVQKGKERKGQKEYLKKIWAKFPNFDEKQSMHPGSSINSKLDKVKENKNCQKTKRSPWKAARKKQLIMYISFSKKLKADFSSKP